MALIGNYSVLLKSPARWMSGSISSGERANWNKSGPMRNLFVGEAGISSLSGVPNGYGQDGWFWPQKGGGMSSYVHAAGAGDASLVLANGINLFGQADGAGAFDNAALALVVNLAGAAHGVGLIGPSELAGVVQLAGQADGNGTATFALNLIVGMFGVAAGIGTAQGVLRGLSFLSGTTEDTGTLSPAAIASAVWAAISSQNASPGSMGEKMNAAGSAGDPSVLTLPGHEVVSAPLPTTTLEDKLTWLVQYFQHKRVVGEGTETLFNATGETPTGVAPITKTVAEYTKGKMS